MEDNLMRRRIMGMLRSMGGGIAVDGVVFSKSFETTYRGSSGYNKQFTIEHNFGILPKLVIAYPDSTAVLTNHSQCGCGMLILFTDIDVTGITTPMSYIGAGFASNNGVIIPTASIPAVTNGTSSTTVTIPQYSTSDIPIKFEVYA